MGENPMKCPKCGNTDINKMIIEFRWLEDVPTNDERVKFKLMGPHDTTTLPKFLYYLRYPKSVGVGFGEFKNARPFEIIMIYCNVCKGLAEEREIKPTRFGI